MSVDHSRTAGTGLTCTSHVMSLPARTSWTGLDFIDLSDLFPENVYGYAS